MNRPILERDQVDLTNCDREPIHIPGAILPHGAMLVLEAETLRVLQAAGDTLGLLGREIEDLLDRPIDTVFSRDQINRLHALSKETDLAKPRHLLDPVLRAIAGHALDASAHLVDGALGSVDSRDSRIGCDVIQGCLWGGGHGCCGSFGAERCGLGADGTADHWTA